MTRKPLCLLIALLLTFAACTSTDVGGDECADNAACAPATEDVPDVEHMELREAHRELIAAGARVEFMRELVKAGYRSYALDRSMGIHPEPWVGDIDPEPGSVLPQDRTVTITSIECPSGARFCD